MRKNKIIYFLCVPLFLILCTCNDPVFYAISQEIKPIPPRIKGVPTNLVIYDGRMYVASGETIFSYNKGTDEEPDKPYWNKETSPGGNILQIASTGDNLYALCSTDSNNNGKSVLRCFNKDDSSWAPIGGILDDYAKLQNIFSAGGVLFVLATSSVTNYNYNILCIRNGSDAFNIMDGNDDTGIINGAAFNGQSYFLPFLSKKTGQEKINGVYKIDDINGGAKIITVQNAEGTDTNVHINGIINLEDSANTILAISRNGEIYIVGDSIVKIENVSMGRMSTGALAIWRENDQPDAPRLLLAGRQDSLYYSSTYGYSYGYMELELGADGIKIGANFIEPGKNPLSTVVDYERYQSSLGKNPVNCLFQVPSYIDKNMILFASTQKGGVWSCRVREDNQNKYWNAEGENEPKY